MRRYSGLAVLVLILVLTGSISNGYAMDCTGSADPACTGDVVAWLAAHPTISNAMVWEDPVLGPLNYALWPSSLRNAFITAFQIAWNNGSFGLADPPANLLILADNDIADTVLAEGDAWSLFISYAAHSIALEMRQGVPWSLYDYSPQDLAIFLDSRETFSWRDLDQGYLIHNYFAVPAPPDVAYSFLANSAMIAPNRLTTIAGLLEWSRNNLLHVGCNTPCPVTSTYAAIMMDWHWQYRGSPPVSRIISGTVDMQIPGNSIVSHWTAGCWATTAFLRAVLRAVNIPVVNEAPASHSHAHFPSEGMYLSHSDDPYSLLVNSSPPSPPEELMIDQAKWYSWFGPYVTSVEKSKNVGRRALELAIEYLPEYLLTYYCDDRSKGLSHAAGSVYSTIFCNPDPDSYCYSLADLEATDLWGRMDAKWTPTIAAIAPLSGHVGSYVYVQGTNFCKNHCRTSNPMEALVSLNGKNISPLWVDQSFLYFQVPAGATTGTVTITTPSCLGPVTSTQVFTVSGAGACATKNCDDGNRCTIDSCDAATGLCVHKTNTWSCDDGNVCTTDSCDSATGNCSHANNTMPCDDSNACTTGDVCTGGVCAGIVGSCDDGNVCTTDICHAATGLCSHSDNTLACDDGNACTVNDVCSAGTCNGSVVACNDNNICTTDSCNAATGCVYAPAVPSSCNDNNACTTDGCTANTCTHVTIACSAGRTCDPATGTCISTNLCSDAATRCNDNNACTTDTCNSATGACTYTNLPNRSSCADSNLCNGAETCQNGACAAGTVLTCNDSNACTIDTCAPATGCMSTAKNCNDNTIYTIDTCDAATGACAHTWVNDGDLDGDGIITVDDALRALRIASGLIPAEQSDLDYGDVAPLVNGIPQPDGIIGIGDAIVTLRRSIGLIPGW